MELIYIHIDKYRNFQPQDISFSNKFSVKYDENEKTIEIIENNIPNMYGNNILNISAIVGKNATGKTSLVDLIGKRIFDRRHNNEIKKKERKPFKSSDGCDSFCEEYVSNYFMIYYIGKGNDDNLFIFESCNVERYQYILEDFKKEDISYYNEKSWFSGVFINKNKKLQFLGDTIDYKNIATDKNCSVISFKHNRSSYDNDDEDVLSVKRRVANLSSNSVYKRIKFLINQMNLCDSSLYNDNEYMLNLSYQIRSSRASIYTPFLKSFHSDKENDKLTLEDRCILNIMHNYLRYNTIEKTFKSPDKQNELLNAFSEKYKTISNMDEFKQYYFDLYDIILKEVTNPNTNIKLFSDGFKRSMHLLEEFFKSAKQHKIDYSIFENSFLITLKKDSDIEEFRHVFEGILDIYPVNEEVFLLPNFLSSKFEYFSDGELFNIDMFAEIDSQISNYTEGKKEYILIFDEIERNMHPEMCRQFISNLIEFLSQYKDKSFQIIIATHSPFIISDIPKENIILLQRENAEIISRKCFIETFGQNIHMILKNEFFMDYTMGEFARSKIIEIRDKLASGDTLSAEALLQYEKTIDLIGEPIIKKHLRQLLETYNEQNHSKEEQIKYYQSKIDELNNAQ
ncbi:MAG: AAA family ATPase [Clostridia bacterium]